MQSTSAVMMTRPANFGFNAETAVNNAFQKNPTGYVHEEALIQFDNLVALLRRNRITVHVMQGRTEPFTPDDIFPNNWISFHENGEVFLYPMFAENRRLERDPLVIKRLEKIYQINQVTDLCYFEKQGLFLEGTGSMVLDRENKIAYAARSARTSEEVLKEFCRKTGFMPITFTATDESNSPIYHSNVMMCIADKYAVICFDCIPSAEEQEQLKISLQSTEKEIIPISMKQMQQFAGNMLQLKNEAGESFLVMSSRAFYSLTDTQKRSLSAYDQILHSRLDAIEDAGGGSARCMIAEIFNPLK